MQKEHLIDFDRKNRIGIPETIFCLDKDVIQIRNIFNDLDKSKTNFFTRLSTEKYSNLPKTIPNDNNSLRALGRLAKLSSGPIIFPNPGPTTETEVIAADIDVIKS